MLILLVVVGLLLAGVALEIGAALSRRETTLAERAKSREQHLRSLDFHFVKHLAEAQVWQAPPLSDSSFADQIVPPPRIIDAAS